MTGGEDMKSTKMKQLVRRYEFDEYMGYENPELENEFMVRAEEDIIRIDERRRLKEKYYRKAVAV